MKKFLIAALLGLAGSNLAGCSMLDRLSGQVDNTVLPGTREDALPGHPQFPEQPANAETEGQPAPETASAETPPQCPADQPDCVPPKTDDVFSDGQ